MQQCRRAYFAGDDVSLPSTGAEHVRAEVGLSFRVTGQDLAAGGVNVELCGDGTGSQNALASGSITGGTTLELLKRSNSNAGAHPSCGPSLVAGASHAGVDTEVRCPSAEFDLNDRCFSG